MIDRKVGTFMDWKALVAVGLFFAKPAAKLVQALAADRSCKREYRKGAGDCGVSIAALDAIMWKSDTEIQQFLDSKGLTTQQKDAAMRYLEGRWYAESKRFEAQDEVQKIKDWEKEHNPDRKDPE